jgi:predicted small secreted protein
VVSDLRKAIAVCIALLVTAFTLGCVRVNWTGGRGADAGEEDPGRAAVSRSLDPDLGRTG